MKQSESFPFDFEVISTMPVAIQGSLADHISATGVSPMANFVEFSCSKRHFFDKSSDKNGCVPDSMSMYNAQNKGFLRS